MIAECQECKQTTEVKSAQEYPALAVLLDFNKASQSERSALICERCAVQKIGSFSYDPYPTASFINLRATNETRQMTKAEYEALSVKFRKDADGQPHAVYKNSAGQLVWGPIEIID